MYHYEIANKTMSREHTIENIADELENISRGK
jgi:hypothetical protein